jgi:hypothetical protein
MEGIMARKRVRGTAEKVKGTVRKLAKETVGMVRAGEKRTSKLIKQTVGMVTGGEKRTRGKASKTKSAARKPHRRPHL